MLDTRKKRNQARILRKKNQARSSRKKEAGQRVKKKRISQEYKNTKILSGEAFLALPDKILSTRISQEYSDLFFQARILRRRNGKRILTDNQENQES